MPIRLFFSCLFPSFTDAFFRLLKKGAGCFGKGFLPGHGLSFGIGFHGFRVLGFKACLTGPE